MAVATLARGTAAVAVCYGFYLHLSKPESPISQNRNCSNYERLHLNFNLYSATANSSACLVFFFWALDWDWFWSIYALPTSVCLVYSSHNIKYRFNLISFIFILDLRFSSHNNNDSLKV